MPRYDAIVIGAGPAGSVTAYRLASAGVSVLLVDKARFPRDKPCGGGLTLRAVRQLPIDVGPVVEHVVTSVEFGVRYRHRYVRHGTRPLILMTQRRRLDAYLADRAAAAGAEFRDGVRVNGVESGPDGITVEIGAERVSAPVLVGADGANGIAARRLGLGEEPTYGVALEGNAPYAAIGEERYRGKAVVELGIVPGGYGWVFPKGDHANVGVGGWQRTGPQLRDHLDRYCRAYGLPPEALRDVRGHRLPLRRPDAVLARGRALVVGDAAGLVDPLSGDGMFEAFVSSRLAAEAALDVLAGRASTLEPYDGALKAALARHTAASWSAKLAFDRFPRLAFELSKPRVVWPVVEALLCGDLGSPGEATGVARGPLKALSGLAKLVGSPGPRYRTSMTRETPRLR
jgi:geranylgeranyl reductase family protein